MTLDKQNETKRKTSTNLDAEIEEKREQAKKLKTQVEQSLKDNYAIKQREDWQSPMFTGMARYLYATDEKMRYCVDAMLTLLAQAQAVAVAIMAPSSLTKRHQPSRTS